MKTLYVLLSDFRFGPGSDTDLYYGIRGIYNDKDHLLEIARLDDIFATEEKFSQIVPVYENEEELPDILRNRIRPGAHSDELLKLPILSKSDGEVFVVTLCGGNGNGPIYMGAMTEDPLLANKLAYKNSAWGGHGEVKVFTLNKKLDSGIKLVRKKNGELKNY